PTPEGRRGVAGGGGEVGRHTRPGVGRGGAGGTEVAVDHGAELFLFRGKHLRLGRGGRSALAAGERHCAGDGGGHGQLEGVTHGERLLSKVRASVSTPSGTDAASWKLLKREGRHPSGGHTRSTGMT